MVENKQSLFFWDVDSEGFNDPSHRFSAARILPVLHSHAKPYQVFALANKSAFELPAASRIPTISHYCVRQYTDFGVEWISRLCGTLFSPGPFGLDYYQEPGSVTHSLELKNSREKVLALEAVNAILRKYKIEHRATQMLLRSVDELLMNAIFDAPIDDKGKRYRREEPLDAQFDLVGKERVVLSTLVNTRSIVVGVFDHFGSFAMMNAAKWIQKDYASSDYKVDRTTKAAGLGLRGIAASGIGTIISSRSGVGTESVIAFPYYKSFKETKTGFRSFSLNID